MKRVLCFGEILLRYAPVMERRWLEDALMEVYVGGSELNVATSLANWGVPVAFFSVMPDNAMARDILSYMKGRKIDNSLMNVSGNRIGVYYLPKGKDLKSSEVIYDRAHSSFSEWKPSSFDWERALKGVDWLHFSAITPALSESLAQVCLDGVRKAAELEKPISVDLNHRSKLWKYGATPTDVMPELVQHCDVIMGNIWSANKLLGIPLDDNAMQDGREAHLRAADGMAEKMLSLYPKCSIVANTFRMIGEEGVHYYAALNKREGHWASESFHLDSPMDMVGSGDCFMAALLYGILHQFQPQEMINFCSAAAVGKMMEKGDAGKQSLDDIYKIMEQCSKPRMI